MTQKRKNDAESAELKTQNYYSAAPPYPSRKILEEKYEYVWIGMQRRENLENCRRP